MKPNIVIIDYQLGNLFSVRQACLQLGHDAEISNDPEKLLNADYAILPGVGAFADAMDNLDKFGLTEAVQEYVKKGKPLMGVCLGLQLLMSESEEFGNKKGLDLIPGTVKKFNVENYGNHIIKVPQIQWNTISEHEPGTWTHSPLKCCQPGDFMYFVHSYYAKPENDKYVLADTTYGSHTYCSAVLKDNVFATQFHPEKSSLYGVSIYKEWLNQNN
jgi:imidazole glycerol-phosphate synthase subunit HisH